MKWHTLLDLIFPRICLGCGGMVSPDHSHICWDCLASIEYVASPYCSLCGDPVEGKVDNEFVCFNCSDTRIHFDRARSAARYRGVIQDLLREYKYRRAIWAANDLLHILEACVHAHYEPDEIDCVVFVPLYPRRRRERGFNQSALLAAGLAKALRRPLLPKCLKRVRATATQTNLTARQRATNVKGAFRARQERRLKGQRVLLVDDVMTTGATVNECARVLKEGGAEKVSVVTVARG